MSFFDDRSWSDVIFGGGNTADPGLWGVGTAIYDVYNKNKGVKDSQIATETAARYSDPNAAHRAPAGDMYMDTLRNPQNWVNNPEMQAFDQHLQRTQLARDSAGGVRGSGAPERLAQRERDAYMRLGNLRKDIAHMATGSPEAAGRAVTAGSAQERGARGERDTSVGTLMQLARGFLDPSAAQDTAQEKKIWDMVRTGMLTPQQAQQMLQERMLNKIWKQRMPSQENGLKGLIDSLRSNMDQSAAVPGVGGTPNMDDFSGATYGDGMMPGGISEYAGGTGGIDPSGYMNMGDMAGGENLSSLFSDLGDYSGFTGSMGDTVSSFMPDAYGAVADVMPSIADAGFTSADFGSWTDAGGADSLFWD